MFEVPRKKLSSNRHFFVYVESVLLKQSLEAMAA